MSMFDLDLSSSPRPVTTAPATKKRPVPADDKTSPFVDTSDDDEIPKPVAKKSTVVANATAAAATSVDARKNKKMKMLPVGEKTLLFVDSSAGPVAKRSTVVATAAATPADANDVTVVKPATTTTTTISGNHHVVQHAEHVTIYVNTDPAAASVSQQIVQHAKHVTIHVTHK